MKLTSANSEVVIGGVPVLIGERINPTGKKKLAEAMREGNTELIASEAVSQEKAGAHLLDVNAGVGGIDEPALLCELVKTVQSVCSLPLVLDSSDPEALKAALKVYNGIPLLNSVNASPESLSSVLPLASESGASVIALTLDGEGIPPTAEGRLTLAERILSEGKRYGLEADRFVFDVLTTAACTGDGGASVTLDALKLVKEKLGAATVLGVSNVSFGLPGRDEMNAAFLTLCLGFGLSAAIMNPLSERMMNAYRAFLAIRNYDEFCLGYVEAFMK